MLNRVKLCIKTFNGDLFSVFSNFFLLQAKKRPQNISCQKRITGALFHAFLCWEMISNQAIIIRPSKPSLKFQHLFFSFQVTLEDGSIRSRQAELKVVTPEAFILAEEEYHIDRGSSLSLVCIIEKATTPPQ